MAIQFVNNLELNQNELYGAALQNLGTDPTNGVLGQVIFNTTSGEIKVCTTASTTAAVFTPVGGALEWIVNASNGLSNQNVENGDKVTFTDTAAISASLSKPAAGSFAVTMTLKDTAVTPGSYTLADITVDAQGRITSAASGSAGGMSTWKIGSTTGTDQTVSNGQVVDVVGGTYISGVIGGTRTVELTHDSTTRSDTTSTASPGSGGTVDLVNTITTNSTGHVTAVDIQTVTFPTNTNTTYTLPTTNGNDPDIVLTGSDGSTDIVNMNGDSTTVKVTGSGTNTLTFDLHDDVTIETSLTIDGSASNALNIPSGKGRSAATAGTDVATTLTTKGYVDGLVEGGLTFLGTFRADTGEILSGGNDGSFLYNVPGGAGTRVAVAVGDYYVVATAGGNFYANTSFPLDIGDSIIGVEAAGADTSVIGDWSLVSQGVTVNSFKADSANSTYLTMSPTTATTGAVELDADLSAVDGTSNTGTRFLSKDNTWDVPSYTTNTDAKYELKASAKVGTSVPLLLDGTNGGSDSTVNLTEGANITLTRNSATSVTIAATDTGALGKRIDLDSTDAWISRTVAGGLTTFAITVTNANVFGAGTAALDVKCEVISAAGQTVYADVTRSGTTLSVIFTGTVADSAYEALLTYVG